MIRLLFILVIGLSSTASCISQKAVDRFIDQNLKHKKAYALSLPGWFVRTTTKAVRKFEDEEESKYWQLTDYIKNFRFLVIDGYNPTNQNDLNQMISDLKAKEHFDEYASFRDKETNVSIYAREKKDKIDNMVFLVNSEDAFVILRLKCKIPLNVFNDLNYQLIAKKTKEDTALNTTEN